MGTFLGHALPGSFFAVFAIWWTIQITRRCMLSKRAHRKVFMNYVYQPLQCGKTKCLQEWPIESVIKIICPTIGLVGEVLASRGWSTSGHVLYTGDLQHATMYGFFILSGIIDILTYHRLTPPSTDYCAATLAFAAEGLLFSFHLHGRSELDVHVHKMLVYVIYGCVVASLIEMKYRTSVLAGIVRTYFVFLQGTWFWHVAFLLHNPFPSKPHPAANSTAKIPVLTTEQKIQKQHERQMMTTVEFTWHMGGVLIAMATLSFITKVFYDRCSDRWVRSQERHVSSFECEKLLDDSKVDDMEDQSMSFDRETDDVIVDGCLLNKTAIVESVTI